MDSALSWLGTAEMAGEAWLRHTTPDKYTRQTLEHSNEALRPIAHDLLEAPPRGIDTALLAVVLAQSQKHIARMARLVRERNAPALSSQLDSLRADQKVVKQLADDIKPKQ
ncbi:MAG TPA: hypothetical protein VK571_03975 [Gemmatimonadaceae bacterium]|nr:hypothetical protein [Gemmatimonadaceae bacterium]